MLIDDANIRVQYDSTAESPIMAGDALPFPFRFIEKEQVKAILLDGTKLIFNEDYTVGLEEEEEEKPEGEDEASVSSDYTSVILNIDIPIGETITLYRETDLDQTSEFPQEARFSSRKIEDALDKLTMQNQEQREALGRAMKLPLTAAVDLKDLALPNPDPNKSVKWNSDGTALVNTNFDPDTALVTTENFKNQAQQSAKDSANSAAESANSATESANSATVAGQKVNEITALHSDYMDDINTTATNYLNQINSRSNTIIKDADAIINRVGLNMFDTVVKDHALTYPDGQGLALQGTYVYRDAIAGTRYGYPDFYNKCIEECTEAQASGTKAITLGSTTLNLWVHPNGHIYYDVSSGMNAIDGWYNTYGHAWFYGIDTANKRIRLPRNVWFEQMDNDPAKVGLGTEAGLPNITGKTARDTWGYFGSPTGALYTEGKNGSDGAGYNGNGNRYNICFDASRSSKVYGKSSTVQPRSVRKLLYICVGNTVSDTSWIDAVTQVQSGVKDLEDKTQEGLGRLTTATNSHITDINSVGQSYANLTQSQITNCILYAEERILHEMTADGKLCIKAGSKYYLPSGPDKIFTEKVLSKDLVFNFIETQTGSYMVACSNGDGAGWCSKNNCSSGTTDAEMKAYGFCLRTDLGFVRYNQTLTGSFYSLPFGEAILNNGRLVEFIPYNSTGRIGSFVWVSPNCTSLIGAGRTSTGQIKNKQWYTSKPLPVSLSGWDALTVTYTGYIIRVKSSVYNTFMFQQDARFVTSMDSNVAEATIRFYFDEKGAKWYIKHPDATVWEEAEIDIWAEAQTRNGYFYPKTTFRPIDYNNKSEIISWGMPDYSTIITGIKSPYTAPTDGLISWNNTGGANCTINGNTFYVGGNDSYNEGNVTLFLSKNDVISFTPDTGTPCFVSLKGAK